MDDLLARTRYTLLEEQSLLDEMLVLSREINSALVNRSMQELQKALSRQQTAIMRLDITRQTQQLLASRFDPEIKKPFRRVNIKNIISSLNAIEELEIIANIESKISELKYQNSVNCKLLDKQFSSLSAYRNLADLLSGNQNIYSRNGEIVERNNTIMEHRG